MTWGKWGMSCRLPRQGDCRSRVWGEGGDQKFGFGHTKFETSVRHPSGGAEKAIRDEFSFREKFEWGHRLRVISTQIVFKASKVDEIICSRITSASVRLEWRFLEGSWPRSWREVGRGQGWRTTQKNRSCINFLMKTMQTPDHFENGIRWLDLHFQQLTHAIASMNVCWAWPASLVPLQAPLSSQGGLYPATAPSLGPRHSAQAGGHQIFYPWSLNPRWVITRTELRDDSPHGRDGWKAELSWDSGPQWLTSVPQDN